MNFASLVDVFSLCNYCVLANVLDYNTYQFPLSNGRRPTTSQFHLRTRYDYNALSPAKRRYYSYVRGLARNFISWLQAHYMITPSKQQDPTGEPLNETSCGLKDISERYLLQQSCAILNYKHQAEQQMLPGVPNCKAVDVQRQLWLLFETDFDIESLSEFDNFAFHDYSWRVSKRTTPLPYECNSNISFHSIPNICFLVEDPYDLGTTKGDKMFMEGTENAFPVSEISRKGVRDDSSTDGDGQDGEDLVDQSVTLKRKRVAS
jgi:hypothetical protein